jgi:hypothetical protein
LENKKRQLIITIDTEGDNLWANPNYISTENALWLPKFQQLCEKYDFSPVYLTDFEMAISLPFIEFAKDSLKRGTCEIGMHIHAKNNPPYFKLSEEVCGGAYLIEYPENIIEQKIRYLKELLENNFEQDVISHRAGRWTTSQLYFNLLIKNGFKYDCSVTPFTSWRSHPGLTQGSKGSDYSTAPTKPYKIFSTENDRYLIEIPVTIRKTRKYFAPENFSIKAATCSIYKSLKTSTIWLRPTGKNLCQMKYLLTKLTNENDSYAEFMLHSSELMPGCSPTFPTQKSIDKLYDDLEELFDYAKELNYIGTTFKTIDIENHGV